MDLFITAVGETFKMCADPVLMGLMFVGTLWGVIVGVLPGVGAQLGVGIALPFTFSIDPVYAIALFVSINVGNAFGNSIPAILIGVPGSASAVLTALDGYALQKQGKGGLALGITYFSSVSAQFLGTFVFIALVVPLSGLAYVFLAPEMAAIYLLGMTTVICISGDNILKGLVAGVFGFALCLVGRDPVAAVTRYAFIPEMRNGIDVIPVTLGLLAVSELFRSMRQSFQWSELAGGMPVAKFPSARDFVRATPRVLIGTAIGSLLGSIPGITGSASAFISYAQSKLWSKHPEEYGHGSIEGIAANEAAQNASQSGECVPTFGLGIPASSSMVLVLAACLMHGFYPGPLMIRNSPQLLWAASGGMMTATVWLALLGWPMSIYMLKLMCFDRQFILISCVALTFVGIFAINSSVFDVFVAILFGMVGYWMRRYGYPVAASAIAMILGKGLETELRRGLLLCSKSWWAFVTRPYTAAILLVTIAFLAYGTWGTIRLARQAAAVRRKAVEAHLAAQK